VKGRAYQVKLGIYSKVHCQRAISFLDRKVIGQNEGGGIKNMEAIDGSPIPANRKARISRLLFQVHLLIPSANPHWPISHMVRLKIGDSHLPEYILHIREIPNYGEQNLTNPIPH
jgi:hypothetical protein